jgi:hypothetical protein
MTNSTSNSQAIAFYQANLQNVTNFGLGYLTERSERQLYNVGKKAVAETDKLDRKVAVKNANPKAGTGTVNYSKVHMYAAQDAIVFRIEQGQTVILLSDLQDDVDANTGREKCGVLWAVRHSKDNGLLAKTTTAGKYRVV